MVSKKKSSIRHFKRRCAERIGTNLDPLLIAKKIRSNKLKFLKRSSLRVTLWEYEFQDQLYVVVYDKNRKTVVTIYPKNRTEKEHSQSDESLFSEDVSFPINDALS